MGDDVLQERAGQLPYPMIPIAQYGLRVAYISKFIAVMTLHVHGPTAQIAILYQFPHPDHGRCELRIMASGDFEVLLICQGY